MWHKPSSMRIQFRLRSSIPLTFYLISTLYTWILDKLYPLNISSKAPVFITGCDTGFGHEAALRFVREGINTFAGCLTEAGEISLKKAAGKSPGKLWTLRLDVTDQSSIDQALDFVKRTVGPGRGLWGLISNAGISSALAPDDWQTMRDYQTVMDVNFFGTVRIVHAFKPLIKLERGRIVVMTSSFGRVACPGLGPYSSSKYAAEGYCDVIRRELEAFGVSVHIMNPGFFATHTNRTDRMSEKMTAAWTALSEETKAEYGEEYFESAIANFKVNFPKMRNTDLGLVTDAYYHALTARRPKLRYCIGRDAKVFPILYVLPTTVQDWIIKLAFHLNGLPQPKVTQSKK